MSDIIAQLYNKKNKNYQKNLSGSASAVVSASEDTLRSFKSLDDNIEKEMNRVGIFEVFEAAYVALGF